MSMKGKEMEYTDSTKAEELRIKQRKIVIIPIIAIIVSLTGLLIATQRYDLSYQEKLINICGIGLFISFVCLALILVMNGKRLEKIDRHAGKVIYDGMYTGKTEVCPKCGQLMTRIGFADRRLKEEIIAYDHTESSAKEHVYTHKRVGVYKCPVCGIIYGDGTME